MEHGSVTFSSAERGRADLTDTLALAGVRFGSPHRVRRLRLDTFDGRLHAAGLRLVMVTRGSGTSLVLTGQGCPAAHLTVGGAPRFVRDLPPGPFRARLARLLDVRALLPLIEVLATERAGTLRDQHDKVVATATVVEEIEVAGGVADLPAWTAEVTMLTGYPKPAKRLIDLVVELGVDHHDGDTLDQLTITAGVDPSGISSSPTVPLRADVPAIDGYRAVFINLLDTVVANWQGTIDDIDPEFLHDLRVAVRRTRSVLAQGKRVVPGEVRDHYRDGFGWLGALTGPARDLEVFVLEWPEYVTPFASDVVGALTPVLAHLADERDRAYRELGAAMRSDRTAELLAGWRAWLTDTSSQDDRPLGQVVIRRIRAAQQQLVDQGRNITPESPADDLHELRKDAKKLRYLIECFGGLLPNGPRKEFVGHLKALQDNLGEHQDTEVHVTQLRDLATRGWSIDTILALGQLTERLDQRRVGARVEFADRFHAYDTKATRAALDALLDGIDGIDGIGR